MPSAHAGAGASAGLASSEGLASSLGASASVLLWKNLCLSVNTSAILPVRENKGGRTSAGLASSVAGVSEVEASGAEQIKMMIS